MAAFKNRHENQDEKFVCFPLESITVSEINVRKVSYAKKSILHWLQNEIEKGVAQ